MSFEYKNPKSSVVLSGPNSVNLDSNTGSNFSSFQVGGFYEVFKLSDLNFTIPSGATGTILYSGNTIPIDFSYNAPNNSPNVINLYSDGVSSGRRKLGMIAYVYENNKTYQYQIPNYETLFNNALNVGSVVNIDFGYQVYDDTNEGQLLLNAWTGSTIEGISGITRDNARWVEFNPEIYITGGTYSSGDTTLYLYDNSGNTIEVSGFSVSVSGGTSGSSGTSGTSGTSGSSGTSGTTGTSGTSGKAIDKLTISGTQNNVNTTFTIPSDVEIDKHLFFWNGILQEYNDSYNISGTTLITTYPPRPNDILTLYGKTVVGVNGTSGSSGVSYNFQIQEYINENNNKLVFTAGTLPINYARTHVYQGGQKLYTSQYNIVTSAVTIDNITHYSGASYQIFAII